MRDQHVVSLFFKITLEDGVTFQSTPILKYENDLFSLHLEENILTIKPKLHYASQEEARKEITPFLRAWQLDDALRMGKITFRFEYKDAEIVDLNPSRSGEPKAILVGFSDLIAVADTVTVVVPRLEFPRPSGSFSTSPDVETLWHRYERYAKGYEPLPGMAYFCLTLLEARGGTRDGASSKFKISKDILDKLGELTTKHGDPSVARKYPRKTQPKPFTPAEVAWIQASVRAIIRRVAEYIVIDQLPRITMADLPAI